MPDVSFRATISGGGVQIDGGVTRTTDNANGYAPALSAGKTVTSWVKTDANTAACNLPGSHGYTDGNFDVYWTAGGVNYVRYSVPGTISTNALSLDGGAGTDFPATATADIVVTKVTRINTAIDGDLAALVAIQAVFADATSTSPAHITFYDASDAVVVAVDLVANIQKVWDITGGATNSFTGNPITYATASVGNSSAGATALKVIVGQDSTP